MCLCIDLCVYLRYLSLTISTDEILSMAAQFIISLCWLFWAAMYSFLFLSYLFCKFHSIFWVQIKLLLYLITVFLVIFILLSHFYFDSAGDGGNDSERSWRNTL